MKTTKVQFWKEIPKNFTGIVERPDGTKSWYKDGNRHREDGPAIEWSDGTREWWIEGKSHRADGPACEWIDGEKHWFKDDKRHREDGPAVERSNGTKEWWFEGQYYNNINLKDYVILDSYQGKYGIMWYRLLDKDKILNYPDIPGLIIKMKAAPKQWK